MTNITVDFNNTKGPIKPMNAVNNGPDGDDVRKSGNFLEYEALEIPYARNHDASFYDSYGGPYTVDVLNIFRDFDADENDPASYLFESTDKYIKNTQAAGTETFYRLGSKIEHYYKHQTRPPKDFAKWARICEHIIRHYNEGWADGFNYGIEYWEIWNEPDCINGDGSNPCWQGTEEQFIEFYEVAARHLKSCFPNLKIGGPAFCSPWKNDFMHAFLKTVKDKEIPLDFFSYHCYAKEPKDVYATVLEAEGALAKAGLEGTFTSLNEWNYVRGWSGAEYRHSKDTMRGLKGSAFVAGTMGICQNSSVDMLMYYDARPSTWNGIWDYYTNRHFKTFYSFVMFRDLRRLGTWIPTPRLTGDLDSIYSCAATNGKDSAIMLTHYRDDDTTPATQVKLDLENVSSENGVRVEYYLLDETHDLEKVKEEVFTTDKFSLCLDMELYSSYMIKIIAL